MYSGSKSAPKGTNTKNSFESIYIGTTQKIAFTNSSLQSTNSISNNVTIVRLYADQDCYIAMGANPTATTSGLYLPGGIIEYFSVNAGDKVAALRSTLDGTLYITEGAA